MPSVTRPCSAKEYPLPFLRSHFLSDFATSRWFWPLSVYFGPVSRFILPLLGTRHARVTQLDTRDTTYEGAVITNENTQNSESL